MKIYIRATTENHDVFEMSTHTSYYDNFLNEKDLEYMRKAKNRDGKIVMMTPDEYYKEASKIFRRNSDRNTDVASLVRQRSNEYTDRYVEDMKNGDKFPLPYLNYADNSQEGLHRMLAAKRAFGQDVKYPVLVVTIYDMDRHNQWKIMQEASDFERRNFYDLVDNMERDLGDWSIAPPKDLAEKAEQYLVTSASKRGADITVECEIQDYDGHDRLDVYLTSYNGYEFPTVTRMENSPWIENMFKTSEDDDYTLDDAEVDAYLDELESKYSDEELDELLSKDLDIDELLRELRKH